MQIQKLNKKMNKKCITKKIITKEKGQLLMVNKGKKMQFLPKEAIWAGL